MKETRGAMNFYRCKKIFLLFLFLLFISPVFASGLKVGTVRFLELIAMHPRMQSFDYDGMRFLDGPSAQYPLTQLQQKDKELTAELEQLSAQVAQAQQQFQTTLTGKSGNTKNTAEKQFWTEKQDLDNKIEELRSEIIANISAMELGGRSIETTLLIEVNKIMYDIKQAIAQAAQKNNCTIILNEVTAPASASQEWVEESFAAYVKSRADLRDPELLRKWVNNSELIAARLPRQINLNKPVLSEHIDLTGEVLKILYQSVNRRGTSK